MLGILLLVITIVIALYLVKIVGSANTIAQEGGKSMPYLRNETLFSDGERSFFEVLSLVAKDNDYLLFAKVRLAELLVIPKGVPNWITHWNRISSKHVDFVVCDRDSTEPLVVVELDDSADERPKTTEKDSFLEEALDSAGLPLLRIKVADSYNPKELAEKIEQAFMIYEEEDEEDVNDQEG